MTPAYQNNQVGNEVIYPVQEHTIVCTTNRKLMRYKTSV